MPSGVHLDGGGEAGSRWRRTPPPSPGSRTQIFSSFGAPCMLCHPFSQPGWCSHPGTVPAHYLPGAKPSPLLSAPWRGSQEVFFLALPAAPGGQEDSSFGLLKCRGPPFGLGGSLLLGPQPLSRTCTGLGLGSPEPYLSPAPLPPPPPPGCGVPEPRGPLRTPGAGLSPAPPVCLQRPLSWLSEAAEQTHMLLRHRDPRAASHTRKQDSTHKYLRPRHRNPEAHPGQDPRLRP